MKADIRVLGDDLFARELARMGDRARDTSPILNEIADDLVAWTREQFLTEGRRASGGWDPLKPETVRRRGSGHPILRDTDELFREMTSRDNYEVGDGWIKFDLDEDVEVYAEAHQHGAPKVSLPARPIAELTGADQRHIGNRLQLWVVKGTLRG